MITSVLIGNAFSFLACTFLPKIDRELRRGPRLTDAELVLLVLLLVTIWPFIMLGSIIGHSIKED